MEKSLPAEIVYRKDKVGFEPPQYDWMQNKIIQDMIFESKKKLVKEKILKQEALHKQIQPHVAHAAENYDWRYLSSGILF
jgi:asparagine synthase (glutamine-hydrolysing)